MMSQESPLDKINRLMASMMPRMPRFRYFDVKQGDPYKFAWTTERDNKGYFWALIYRKRKDGTWVLKKKRKFKKRRIAKARALKWRIERGKLLESAEDQ